MFEITKKLIEMRDEKNALFQAKLTPGVNENLFLGIKIPVLRKLAKDYLKDPEAEKFMHKLPHKYFDENMLHAAMLCELKDYDKATEEIERFLPFVDNWAVCDTIIPKVYKKNPEGLIFKVKEWMNSPETYTCRFGTGTLMRFYLDDSFKPEYLEWPAKIVSDEYYVNMMTAWYYATALAKHWDETVIYIEEKRLPKWVHNKSIQKARESFRVSDDRKEYLKSLKV